MRNRMKPTRRSMKTSKAQRLALFNGIPPGEMAPSLRRALMAKGLIGQNGRATPAGKEVVARMKQRARRMKARDGGAVHRLTT